MGGPIEGWVLRQVRTWGAPNKRIEARRPATTAATPSQCDPRGEAQVTDKRDVTPPPRETKSLVEEGQRAPGLRTRVTPPPPPKTPPPTKR